MATMVAITGGILLPDDSAPVDGVLRWVLSGADTEAASSEVVAPFEVSVELDGAGAVPSGFEVWPNTEGLRGTFYRLYLSHAKADAFGGMTVRQEVYLGAVQVAEAATVQDLLDNPAPETPGWNVNLDPTEYAALLADIAGADAAATAAQVSADAAEAAAIAAGAAIYPNTAAGIADVADGALFYVPASGGGLTIYERDGASAAVAGAIATLTSTDHRTPSYFGIQGGGADDSASITDAMQSGLPIDWGAGEYRFGDPVLIDGLAVRWRAQGARLIYIGDPGAGSLFSIREPSADVLLEGMMEIDGGMLAHRGLYFRNNSDTYRDVFASALSLKNFKKTDLATAADGLWMEGSFDAVHFQKLRVRNVQIGTGAGNPGFSGASGATFKALSNTRFLKNLIVEAAWISGIYAEDPLHASDMDGIRAFSPEDTAMTADLPDTGMRTMIGAIMAENCRGRVFKGQAQHTVIGRVSAKLTGTMAYAPSGVCIDCQTGGGQISDVHITQSGGSAYSVGVNVSTPQTEGLRPPQASVARVHVLSEAGSPAMKAVVNLTGRTAGAAPNYDVRDVQMEGATESLVGINAANGIVLSAQIDGLRGDPDIAFVYAYASGGSGTIDISGVQRTNGNTAPVYNRSSTSLVYTATETDLRQTSATDTTAGALLTVGAFGLGGVSPAWPTADLNDDTSVGPGVYYTGAASNRPSGGGAGFVEYSRFNNNSARMVFTSVSSTGVNRIWRRDKRSGTWSAWKSDPIVGTGSPEGVVTAEVGALYARTDGGSGTYIYLKTSGTGNTGWTAVA